jgi:hypothetical protein
VCWNAGISAAWLLRGAAGEPRQHDMPRSCERACRLCCGALILSPLPVWVNQRETRPLTCIEHFPSSGSQAVEGFWAGSAGLPGAAPSDVDSALTQLLVPLSLRTNE